MDEYDDMPFNFADEDVIPEPPEMDDDMPDYGPSHGSENDVDDDDVVDSEEPEYEDGMDGDAESAFASCGWGTDEDYGYYGGDE
jgi:hypothetical protein